MKAGEYGLYLFIHPAAIGVSPGHEGLISQPTLIHHHGIGQKNEIGIDVKRAVVVLKVVIWTYLDFPVLQRWVIELRVDYANLPPWNVAFSVGKADEL